MLAMQLAIDGASPVRNTFLPYARHVIDEDDIQAVADALRSDWITSGPKVGEFEALIAHYVGAPHAIAVNSCTAALHLSLVALGIGPGDEVILPAETFVASANAILYAGATPVFADIDPRTWNLDPQAVTLKITPQTKAIIPVDYAGLPCDLDELKGFGLPLVEDAAHSLGGSYKGTRVGSICDLTCLSFHAVKNLTTAEGGMITTANAEWAARLKSLRSHGIGRDAWKRFGSGGGWFFTMDELGYKVNLTDMAAALGISQLKKYDQRQMRRHQIARRYTERLGGRDDLMLQHLPPDRESGWHLYVIQLAEGAHRLGRDEIFAAMRAENIGVNVHFIPAHLHPFYQGLGWKRGDLPVTEHHFDHCLTLPLFPAMTDQDVDDVVTALEKVLGAYRR